MVHYLDLEDRRRHFIDYVRRVIGAPYRWAAQGPDMYDCSGLVVAGLHAVEMLPTEVDMTAAQLEQHFADAGCPSCAAADRPGQLCFYGAGSKVHHVMIVLAVWDVRREMSVLVGARGGASTTTTLAEAWRRGAMVCTVRGDYWRRQLVEIRDPFYFKGIEE